MPGQRCTEWPKNRTACEDRDSFLFCLLSTPTAVLKHGSGLAVTVGNAQPALWAVASQATGGS